MKTTSKKPNKYIEFLKLVLKDQYKPNGPAFFAKETKLAKKLLQEYPDELFWKMFRKPDCIPYLQSLAQLYTECGKAYLITEYSAFKKSLYKGEDITTQPSVAVIPPKLEEKPKSVLDFLRKKYG